MREHNSSIVASALMIGISPSTLAKFLPMLIEEDLKMKEERQKLPEKPTK